jgi:hypothetical protein
MDFASRLGLVAVIALGSACLREPEPQPWNAKAVRGLNVACWWRGCMTGPAAADTLSRARELGASHVALVSTWYVPNGWGGAPAPHPQRSPALDEVEALASSARAQGLEVMLKPHVNRLDGGSRTTISPADLDAWWSAYERYVLQVAELGQRVDAHVLAVGTELGGLSGDGERWRALIAAVREHYFGVVTYAANWDEVEGVTFFDALDWVGVDGYYPLAPAGATTVLELVQGWQSHLLRLRRLDVLRSRPLVLTEIGAPAEDAAAQARYYRAALVALHGEGGALAWNLWEGAHGGTHVIGQPAQEALCDAWR